MKEFKLYFDEKKNNKKIRIYLENIDDPSYKYLRDEILRDAREIVKGVIHTHRLTRFEPFEDLFQEGIIACMKSIKGFNPNFVISKGEKVKLFSYFSLVSKKSMVAYTFKTKNHRQKNIGIEDYKVGSCDLEDNIHIEEIINMINKIVYPHKKHRKILIILTKIIRENPEFFDKKFFRDECRRLHISDFKRHSFLRFLKNNKKLVDFSI